MLKVFVSTQSTQGDLPVGLVVGRRAWNDARGAVDNLTYRGVAAADARSSA